MPSCEGDFVACDNRALLVYVRPEYNLYCGAHSTGMDRSLTVVVTRRGIVPCTKLLPDRAVAVDSWCLFGSLSEADGFCIATPAQSRKKLSCTSSLMAGRWSA